MAMMRFEGGRELAAALGQLSTRVSRKIQRSVLTEQAEPMRAAMAAKAPRAPARSDPTLAEEMTISNARGADLQEVAIVVGPSKRSFYGSFQEYGTVNHSPQPFARPAFDGHARSALRGISAGLWSALTSRRPPRRSPGGGGLL